MRLRRGIVALVVLGSVQLPAAMRASAATNAVTFPSSVTFPIVTLPVFDTGPRLAVTVRNDTASSVKLGVPRIEGANAALFSIVGVKEPRTVLPGDAWAYNVEFLPYVGGTYRATLAFSTNGADHAVDLVGTARSEVVLGGNLAGYRFVAMSPLRVLDSRTGLGWSGVVPAGGTQVLTLPAGTIDAAAGAVVLNVTTTNTTGPGYVTVWPAGKPQPTASNLNVERAGQTIANLATVGLGAGGTIAFFSTSTSDLVADIAGYFLPTAPTASGRYQPVMPARLLDTRDTGGPFIPGEQRDLAVTGRGGVPPTGVSAVMLNLTSTNAAGAGFVTVWPAGIVRPVVSNVNTDSVGQTIANQVVVSLPASGKLSLYSHQRSDVVVDVVGWYTDASAAVDVVGLFFPVGPLRLLDTRVAGPVAGRDVIAVIDATAAGVSADATGVTANVTAVDALDRGYVTVWSGAGSPPLASNLNLDRPGQTVPNQVTSPLATGHFSIYTQNGSGLVVDITGFYRDVGKTAFAAR